MNRFLLWIWQAPQNIAGAILVTVLGVKIPYAWYRGRRFYACDRVRGGISLGDYIVISREDYDRIMFHEYGHSVQSRRLGPLYLLLIGLPSAVGYLWDRWFHTTARGWTRERANRWYFGLPWEREADRLGGVQR